MNYFAFFREEERQKNLLNQFRLWKLLKRKHWNIVVTERAKKEMADQEQSMRRWWSFIWLSFYLMKPKIDRKGQKWNSWSETVSEKIMLFYLAKLLPNEAKNCPKRPNRTSLWEDDSLFIGLSFYVIKPKTDKKGQKGDGWSRKVHEKMIVFISWSQKWYQVKCYLSTLTYFLTCL